MKTVLVSGFLLAIALASNVSAVVSPERKEIPGTGERWSEPDRRAMLSGAQYQFSPDAEITDQLSPKMNASFLRQGVSDGIIKTGSATQVLVAVPRGETTSHQPGE